MSTAAKIDSSEAFTCMGSVKRSDETIVVATSRGDLFCKRAVGCLVAPELGDFVVVAGSPTGGCFVLSVLERESRSATLSVDGDLEVSLGRGALRILARDGIDLLTPRRLRLAGEEISLTAERARAVIDELSYLGGAIASEVGKIRARATSVDSFVGRLSQRVKASFRKVEQIDQLDAGQIDHKASETLTLRADCALVNAKKIVRMDGEQIMMG